MNAVELALAKQRLQIDCARQRETFGQNIDGLMPLFNAADRAHAGARWLIRHPEVVAGGVALLVAVRPHSLQFFWRWGQRSFFAWRLWRDSEHWLGRFRIRPIRKGVPSCSAPYADGLGRP